MTNVKLTEEKQYEIIGLFEEILNELNTEQPPLAGEGSLDVALSVLQLSIAQSVLHLQRTFVLVEAIRGVLDSKKQGFVKSGEKFNGPAPIK